MKKFKKIVFLLFLSNLLFVVGCNSNKTINTESVSVSETQAQTETESTEESKQIEYERKFIVGFDAEYPPYGYMASDGSYTGFDLELAEEVCKRNNWQLVKQPIDWDSKDLELLSAKIDCIWNGFTITGREDKYTWTVPYVDNSIVFVVNNDSNINSKSDLSGKIVTTQAGSSALTALESEENKNLLDSFKSLEQVPDYNTAFMNLESGLVDAIAVDIGVAMFQLNNRKNIFKMLDEELSKEQYAVGFRYGNPALRNRVQDTMFEMYKDGTFMEIANKYADYNLPSMICLGNYIEN